MPKLSLRMGRKPAAQTEGGFIAITFRATIFAAIHSRLLPNPADTRERHSGYKCPHRGIDQTQYYGEDADENISHGLTENKASIADALGIDGQ